MYMKDNEKIENYFNEIEINTTKEIMKQLIEKFKGMIHVKGEYSSPYSSKDGKCKFNMYFFESIPIKIINILKNEEIKYTITLNKKING